MFYKVIDKKKTFTHRHIDESIVGEYDLTLVIKTNRLLRIKCAEFSLK